MKRLWIRGGRIVDPGLDIDALGDLLIVGGKVADVRLQGEAHAPREMADAGGDEIVNATGCVVCPGFVDLHCHLREPGQEDKEDIWTGTMAAARGGFTTVCAMGNTKPPTDSASAIAYQIGRASCRERVFGLV
jgi:dihydroorotase